MRRIFTLILLVAIAAVVRELLMDRSPRQGVDGGVPVIGSLDTWPDVPRNPAA
jgi:hypothetical protein